MTSYAVIIPSPNKLNHDSTYQVLYGRMLTLILAYISDQYSYPVQARLTELTIDRLTPSPS
jgi:hypothetical protein